MDHEGRQNSLGYAGGARDTYPSQAEQPYLDRLVGIAGELEASAERIELFIARCRGGGEKCADTLPRPMATGHFGQLDRVQEAMSRLDLRASVNAIPRAAMRGCDAAKVGNAITFMEP